MIGDKYIVKEDCVVNSMQLKKGDIIGQGIFKEYLTTEDDAAGGERTGGFGSTSK